MNCLLTKQDLAQRYQVSERTIEIWVRAGHFPRPLYLHRRAPRWQWRLVRVWENRRQKMPGA